MANLHNVLMSDYKSDVVPRNNNVPINVRITFYLMSLIRFDETEETLVTAAWLSMSWQDQFLMWSEKPEYENITNIYLKPQFILTLTLHRRRTYYMLTVCVPIIVLSILNCLVYLLPPYSGEKMSVCLMILLAYMVYVSFLSDNLPRTSNSISYMLIYLCLMFCMSFLSVFNSVIVLLLWHKSDGHHHHVDNAATGDDEEEDDNDKSKDVRIGQIEKCCGKSSIKCCFYKVSRV